MSKRRYSKKEKYAIPYNGEEVYLHWANSDQYYIKTSEHFTDYSFASKGIIIHFKLQNADVEQNNVKGDKRFFIPKPKEASFDKKAKNVIIPFEYRPLTEQEQTRYGNKNQQDKILEKAIEQITGKFEKDDAVLAALSAEKRKNADGKSVSFLEHHLRQYTRRNTSDFFIHKDLETFLKRELDFYIKNEVLNVDDIEAGGQDRAEGWFQVMKVIRNLGYKIIAFLAQIENFQKKLFEKKKFVTETQYCITVGNIDGKFYDSIADNDAQWAEWKELFAIDEEEKTLFNSNAKSRKDKRIAFLKAHPTLVLDTKHFNSDFVDKLLASFDDIDEATDGLLIHSENWQALNLLLEKYHQKVKYVYIDPPFNSKSTEILYKNDYKHSSWLSLMQNRLELAATLLTEKGVLTVAIDENEQERLGFLLDKQFPEFSKTCVTVIHNPGGIQGENFSYSHEYAYFIFPSDGTYIGKVERDDASIFPLRDWGGEDSKRDSARNCFYPIYVKGNKVIGFGDVCPDDFHPSKAVIKRKDGSLEIYPVDPSGAERKWRFARQSVEKIKDQLTCDEVNGEKVIRRHKSVYRFKTVWTDNKYNSNIHGSKLLGDILGHKEFTFPKSLYNVVDCIHAATQDVEQPIILDYFAGSGTTGHAVIHLNRKDAGQRKFILVEMGNYFDTVLLPRIKKVTFSPEWKDGKPKRMATKEEAERSPRIIKYQRIESYEDALNNISFRSADGQTKLMQFDDYLLNYMLEFETKGSETFLNIEKLASPFSYKLVLQEGQETKEREVDLPETFNYLLGLHVKTRKVLYDNGKKYLVYRGTVDHKEVVVIWRETKGWGKKDYERDKKFVAEKKLTEGTDEVFVNGDSFIPKAKALDPVFKRRMFAGVE